jgi:hypothetical protein
MAKGVGWSARTLADVESIATLVMVYSQFQ